MGKGTESHIEKAELLAKKFGITFAVKNADVNVQSSKIKFEMFVLAQYAKKLLRY